MEVRDRRWSWWLFHFLLVAAALFASASSQSEVVDAITAEKAFEGKYESTKGTVFCSNGRTVTCDIRNEDCFDDSPKVCERSSHSPTIASHWEGKQQGLGEDGVYGELITIDCGKGRSLECAPGSNCHDNSPFYCGGLSLSTAAAIDTSSEVMTLPTLLVAKGDQESAEQSHPAKLNAVQKKAPQLNKFQDNEQQRLQDFFTKVKSQLKTKNKSNEDQISTNIKEGATEAKDLHTKYEVPVTTPPVLQVTKGDSLKQSNPPAKLNPVKIKLSRINKFQEDQRKSMQAFFADMTKQVKTKSEISEDQIENNVKEGAKVAKDLYTKY